jgi:fatty-acyl-CoA synthase
MPIDPITPTPSAYGYPLLIKQLWHTPLATAPDQEIVYRDQLRLTYREVRQRVGRLAHVLRAHGVQPGDTVAVMDWDSHRYLESYFAIPMMGAVLMTANVRLSPDQIVYTLTHSGASVVLVNAEFLPLWQQIRSQLPGVRTALLLADEPTELPDGFAGEYEALLTRAAHLPDYEFPDFDENARATTFYTTGTTGLPKGVFFSHRQLVLHTLAVLGALASAPEQGRVSRNDVYMPITPMFHVHAWGMPFVTTVLGLKQVYPGRYVPDMLLALKQKEGVTFSHCVPTILHMLLTSPAAAEADLKGWKVIIGGSALTKGLAQAGLDRGMDLFTGYGMSETCPILTLSQIKPDLMGNDLEELDIRTRTGLPIPLVDLRIVDGQMEDVPHDGRSPGEVVVRAPWLTQGYYQNPQASEVLWSGGYLHTNDIGVIDRHGYLRVTDRIKDVIKTGGEWVSSLEVEGLLSRHPSVSEVAVIGVPDAKWGERPMALIVLKPGASEDVPGLTAIIDASAKEGHISRYAVPAHWRFVENIDKTSVGKLNKKVLREKYTPEA